MQTEKWALVDDDVVTEVIDQNPKNLYPAAMPWHPCNSDVEPGWNFDGENFTAPPSANLEDEKSRALANIDHTAGAARAAFVSPGSYIDQEYLLARQEAAAWLNDGQNAEAVPSTISAHMAMFAVDAETAAEEIIATAEQWETALREIRQLRLGGKAAVQRADTIEAAEEAAQHAIEQLNRYRPPEA